MESVNYVQILFSLMITAVITVGSLVNTVEDSLPVIFVQIFRYGKFAYNGKTSFLRPIQVPKSWFRHFYIFSSVLMFYTSYLIAQVYVFKTEAPEWVIHILDVSCGAPRQSTTNITQVSIAVSLLTVQCLRRLYDTNFVSVFGEGSKMDLAHYLIGFIHYMGAVLAILSEAPQFADRLHSTHFDRIRGVDAAAIGLFLWAWWHQFKSTVILANLRKNAKGHVVTDERKLPMGDWFDYVSSPHLLAEVLMYFSLTLLLWNNLTWWFIFAWVACNQVETALLSHWWYRDTFHDFPKHRKALIPFLY